jgi:predicted Zn-dependent protease
MASVALDQNKVDEAIVMLKSAMTLEPLMPDTYGLLADAYLAQGLPGWDDALSALNEALSIDNENARHWVRKASLLRDQAMASKEDASSLLTQADEAIKAALDLDKNHASAQELAACIILDRGGDADQAEWFLNQSKKRRDTSFGLVQRARTLIRKGTFDDVERLITKALKIEPSNHAAFAAQAEMWEGQGQIFHAFEAIKGAKERSHKDSAARIAYAIHMERLGALIESGAAAEMMKSAGLDQPVDTAPITTDSGERRDPGTTTIRRPKKTEEDSKDLLTETDSEDQPVASAETKESGEE